MSESHSTADFIIIIIIPYHMCLLDFSDNAPIGQKLKLIAKVCKHHLAPLLSNKMPDITSPPPPSSHSSGSQEGVFTRPTQPGGIPGGPNPQSSSSGMFSPPPQREENATGKAGGYK